MSHQYLDHRPDSAKGKVHEVFDTKGKDAAIKKAIALGKQESTARTWCSQFKDGAKTKKKAAPAKAAKKTVKKAAPAKKKAPAKKAPAKREKLAEQRASA